MISAAGITGDVREIGLFATTVDTVDNLRVVVGNNKILSDNIVNYTTNPFRRVDLKAQLAQKRLTGAPADQTPMGQRSLPWYPDL